MSRATTIAVLGGGNGAFAAAADLTLRGFSVRLLEVPELAAETITPVRERGALELLAPDLSGVASGPAVIDVITDRVEEAVVGAEIVLYVVPAFAERRFSEWCLPYFHPDQLVVLFCGNFGGALELAGLFNSQSLPTPLIAEVEGLVYSAVKQGPTAVRVSGIKAGLACAALPAQRTHEALERVLRLFPGFQAAANVLETSLRNLNPVLHVPVSVTNAGRTSADKPKWRFYWDGVTEPVGRLVQQVDSERLSVGRAIDLDLPSALDVLLSWYGHQGARGSTIAEAMSTNPAYEIAWAPETLAHRFITEDVPFGLVPIEALASSVGIPTPTIGALITLSSQLLDVDFRARGRNLAHLGIEGLSREQVRHLVEKGSASGNTAFF